MNYNGLERHLKPILELAIREDIGNGDITTEAIFQSTNLQARGEIIAKDKSILCGLSIVDYVFNYQTEAIKNSKFFFPEGAPINRGDKVYEVIGDMRRLLSFERIALNFLQRLSGIASKTKEFVNALGETSSLKILDTRKTIPGYRLLEKYAVKMGGGDNHRHGLFDMFMIKDNHIELAGGIKPAIKLVRIYANKNNLKENQIVVECKQLDQVKEAVSECVDIIMLDNMTDSSIKQAIKIIPNGIKIEISGNITPAKILTLSRLKADFISCGSITHSAVAKDFSMQIIPLP